MKKILISLIFFSSDEEDPAGGDRIVNVEAEVHRDDDEPDARNK